MAARLRHADAERPLGEALQDQALVAGIGNMWMSESLWHARLSPWLRLGESDDQALALALHTAATLMRTAVEEGREPDRRAYGRAGRPCPRCGAAIRSFGQGDANRTAYWCPRCQPGPGPADQELRLRRSRRTFRT